MLQQKQLAGWVPLVRLSYLNFRGFKKNNRNGNLNKPFFVFVRSHVFTFKGEVLNKDGKFVKRSSETGGSSH